ncbi:hypothetical protein Tco_1058553 [Tanacetum coccineum]|uniref:Uncharacterized protein n=1 Tax=Tanacetum coccineum TaxID=301880 RepID=A0ABQ5H8N3_9ASTR
MQEIRMGVEVVSDWYGEDMILLPSSVLNGKSPFELSSAEAEYRSMASVTCEAIWLSNLLGDMGVKGLLSIMMYCDNSLVASSVIKTKKIHTSQQIADVLTKALDIEQHKLLCDNLGMLDMFKVEKLKGWDHSCQVWIVVAYIRSGAELLGGYERGDGVTSIKRRRRDLSSDGVEDLTTTSGCNRLKSNLEDST